MSYSFSVSGKSKDEVREKTSAEMDKVIAQQPNHSKDKDALVSSVSAYVDLLDVQDGDTISVSVSGSLGWSIVDSQPVYNGVGLNISARLHKTA